jgi:hypothetical protein
MRFIAIDVENNQPSGQITQIGAAAFDCTAKKPYEPIASFDRFLELPSGEALNWNQELRGGGGTLGKLLGDCWLQEWTLCRGPRNQVFTEFWQWVNYAQCGKKFVQWGGGDLAEIIAQSKEAGVCYPSGLREVNLKRMYQMFFQPALGLPKQHGLKAAVQNIGAKFEGRAHDAWVDAKNTGALAVKMFGIVKGYGQAKAALENKHD